MARQTYPQPAAPDAPAVSGRPFLFSLFIALRPHQWTKNLLVFAALLAEQVVIVQTNAAGDNIHLIDPSTNTIVGEIKGIEVNHGAAAAPDGSRFYFSNEAEETLDVVAANDANFRNLAGLETIDPEVMQAGVGGPGLGAPESSPLWSTDSVTTKALFATGYDLSARRKLLLVEALAHRPALTLLDEPFHGLDMTARGALINLLRFQSARRGIPRRSARPPPRTRSSV